KPTPESPSPRATIKAHPATPYPTRPYGIRNMVMGLGFLPFLADESTRSAINRHLLVASYMNVRNCIKSCGGISELNLVLQWFWGSLIRQKKKTSERRRAYE